MKNIIIAAIVILFCQQAIAQKYLDIYQDGKVVNSIATTDIDSIGLMGESFQDRTINFYRSDNIVKQYFVKDIDSIKVFRSEDEQLVYLGIVGFNQELYEKSIDILASSTSSTYQLFVDNLIRKDGTLLYYAADHALDMLTNYNFNTPLSHVVMITFTDGLDQGSLMMNGNYNKDEEYLDAIKKRVENTSIKGLPIIAYSLGLRGDDVTNDGLFQNNLNKLASSSDKAFEVNNMNEVSTRLQEISDQLISISNSQTFSLKIPGQSTGTVIRFTLDGEDAKTSKMYIEGTFNLAERSLTNVSYHGIKATTGKYVQGTQDGIFVTFTFTGIQREDGNGLVPVDNTREYYLLSGVSDWQHNSEFTPENNTQTTISHFGAAIIMVLDCSNSLGTQFGDMKKYVKDFIDRLSRNTVNFSLNVPQNVVATIPNDRFEVQITWDAVKHAESYDVYRSNNSSKGFELVASGVMSPLWIDETPLLGNNYYRISAVGHGLVTPTSNTSNGINYGLDKPTNVSASFTDEFFIQVSWDMVKYAESYNIYRSNSIEDFMLVADGVTSTSWIDKSPLSGKNYYRVCAIGHNLISPVSEISNMMEYSLESPSNVRAIIPEDNFVIQVNWDAVDHAESYEVYRSSDASTGFSKIASGITSTSWTDENPIQGNNYYRIFAVCRNLTSSSSSTSNVVNYALDAPTDVRALLTEDFVIRVSWNATKYAESYDIYRSSNSATGYNLIASGITSTSWVDMAPLEGNNYYRVYAIGHGLISSYNTSNVIDYSLEAPSQVMAIIPDNDFVVQVLWNNVEHAESYDVYRSSNSSNGFIKVGSGVTVTKWTDNTPLIGDNFYRIYAKGHGLTSAPSITTAYIKYMLDAPQNVKALYNKDEKCTYIFWDTVSHAECYEVYRGDEMIGSGIFTNTWKDTTSPSGKIVYYVCAVARGLKSEKSRSTEIVVGEKNVISVNYNGSVAYVTVSDRISNNIVIDVKGANVSIIQNDELQEEIIYEISGNSNNGSFYMDGNYKATIVLKDLNLTNPNGSAIEIENGKHISININGNNYLSDGFNGTNNATFYVNGHCTFSGDGKLVVDGNTKHAIKIDEHVVVNDGHIIINKAKGDGINISEYVVFNGGNVSISANGDGIDVEFRGVNKGTKDTYENNGFIFLNNGTLNITSIGDASKGIKCDSSVVITGGNINITTSGAAYYDTTEKDITSSSAIKCDGSFTMSAGNVRLLSTGSGGKGLNATEDIKITGGTLSAVTTGNRYKYDSETDTKSQGIKTDKNIILSGGNIYAAVVDKKSTTFKTDYDFRVDGATIMGIGGKEVVPSGTQRYKTYSNVAVLGGQTISYNGVSFTVPATYSNTSAAILVSSPRM